MPGDADVARALVAAQLRGTRYLARALEVLDAALRFEDPEYLAVVAERRAHILALALFGTVAGARQCTKLHALVGRDDAALTALASGVVQVAADAGERLVVCELADDRCFSPAARALPPAGFGEEGRVDDYVADGVALRLLVWRRPSDVLP